MMSNVLMAAGLSMILLTLAACTENQKKEYVVESSKETVPTKDEPSPMQYPPIIHD